MPLTPSPCALSPACPLELDARMVKCLLGSMARLPNGTATFGTTPSDAATCSTCKLLMLAKVDFDTILQDFKEDREVFRRVAKERVADMISKSKKNELPKSTIGSPLGFGATEEGKEGSEEASLARRAPAKSGNDAGREEATVSERRSYMDEFRQAAAPPTSSTPDEIGSDGEGSSTGGGGHRTSMMGAARARMFSGRASSKARTSRRGETASGRSSMVQGGRGVRGTMLGSKQRNTMLGAPGAPLDHVNFNEEPEMSAEAIASEAERALNGETENAIADSGETNTRPPRKSTSSLSWRKRTTSADAPTDSGAAEDTSSTSSSRRLPRQLRLSNSDTTEAEATPAPNNNQSRRTIRAPRLSLHAGGSERGISVEKARWNSAHQCVMEHVKKVGHAKGDVLSDAGDVLRRMDQTDALELGFVGGGVVGGAGQTVIGVAAPALMVRSDGQQGTSASSNDVARIEKSLETLTQVSAW